MPKMKTSKTAAKRFKFTGTGKLRRQQSMRQHFSSTKHQHVPVVSTETLMFTRAT